MILDAGICTIHRVDGTERRAYSPTDGLPQIYRNWCGKLGHESGNGGARTMRIRIHDEDIMQHDVALFGGRAWIVTRVYHGTDDETGQPIADITMETGERVFDRLKLIATTPAEPPVNDRGFANPPTETARNVWAMRGAAAHIEYTDGEAHGIRAEVKISVYAAEYRGEMLAEYHGKRYTVERTNSDGGALIELTLDNAAKGGAPDGQV